MVEECSKITCIIPTFRRPESLRRAILSVLGQSYGNLKVGVFDDASGDMTEKVVNQLVEADPRVFYHLHSNNIGSEPNFKFAIESVDTAFFSILSDDDLLAPEFYEKAIDIMNENSDVMFVILDTLIIDNDNNLIQLQNRVSDGALTFYRDDHRFEALHSGVIPSWNGIVFRREVADIYKNMSHNNDIGHDHKFLIHAAAKYDFAHLSHVGAFFVNHPDSFSSNWEDFDQVRHYSKVTRYIEVANDKSVSPYIRERARSYLNQIISVNPNRQWTLRALKRFFGHCCSDMKMSRGHVETDIINSRRSGYLAISNLIRFVDQQRIIKAMIKGVFGNYYKNKKKAERDYFSNLQNGVYKGVFQCIKNINDKEL